jgi:hypothetical protein
MTMERFSITERWALPQAPAVAASAAGESA